ncbi:hypothetical protein [Novosphingobium sp.]|uniref:hypothetical protein n=1 Tax=Novosphingobium sp. TaxID=1874826 RepID=UPI0035B3B266
MEKIAPPEIVLDDAIAAALADLFHVRSWGATRHVSLPFFYPSGSNVVVKVEKSFGGFAVSDNGLAYRELDNVGGARFFSSNVKKVAEPIGAWHDSRAIVTEVDAGELAAAIAEIGSASSRLVWRAMDKIDRLSQSDVIDHLYSRLDRIFGQKKVERGAHIFGPSTHEWEVDALVHVDGQDAVFEFVSNHHNSVYPASAMFHDLALIESPPALTAVVPHRGEFGYLLNILAQAANVIEQGQPDTAYQQAAKWII